jgi:uncharacterized protein YicC (UPF0701 family)
LSLKGVIEAADAVEDPEVQGALEAARAVSIASALDELAAARTEEGRALLGVLGPLVDHIGTLTSKSAALAQGQPALIKARFEKRLTELAGEAATEERILQEAAAMAV